MQQSERQFRYIGVGPVLGPPDGIQTNALTSDDFALNVFDRYYSPFWVQNGRQLGNVNMSVPNQSGTPLPVSCQVEQDQKLGGAYVRCTSPDGSVTAFDLNTLLAVTVP